MRAALRAWVLGAARRPLRGLVVVLTLALMTLGTTAALVAGDSLDRLFEQDALAEWGEVDVELTSVQGPFLSEGLARFLGDDAGPRVTAAAPRLLLPGVVRHEAQQQPDVLLLGLGPEEQQFGELSPVAGASDVGDLALDQALVNQRLATRLGLRPGDVVEAVIGVPEHVVDLPGGREDTVEASAVTAAFSVAGVVADAGVADLHRTPNLLLRRDALQRITGLTGLVSALHLGVAGDPDAHEELTTDLRPTTRRVGLEPTPVQHDALLIAEDEGGQFRSLLFTLALLVVASAAVAATQMLTALAEDRSAEIAVLRVHGASPATIRRLVTAESVLYAILGIAVGTLAALPVAGAVAGALADHFATLAAGRGREQVALVPVVAPVTVLAGGVIVLVGAWLAGRVAGRRLGDVELDLLLRGPLTQLPTRPLDPRRPIALALLGALVLGSGLSDAIAADALRYLGLSLLLAAWWAHRRRGTEGRGRHRIDRRAALLGLVWATGGAVALADFSQGYEIGFGMLVLAGTISVVSVTVLVASRFRDVMRLLRAYVPRGSWQAALRTAGAYAEESPGRTGRLHATFAIVLFVAAALHVLGNAQAIPVDRQSGGYDVIGRSVVGLGTRSLRAVEGVGQLTAAAATSIPEDHYGVERAEDDPLLRVRYPVRLLSVEGGFPAEQAFGLASSLPEYRTAEEALEAVLRDGDKAVVDRYGLPPGAGVGDELVLELGGVEHRYELVAVLDTFLLGGAAIAETEYDRLVSSHGHTFVLAAARAGTSPSVLADRLESSGAAAGLDVRTVAAAAAELVAVNRTFTDVFALMLLIGLGVALVAVAATTIRSATERRAELGTLAAIGLSRRTLVLTVAAEPAAVALVGSVLGLGVGLVVLRVLFAAGFSDLAFVLDAERLAGVLAVLAVALAVTGWVSASLAVPRAPAPARDR